MSTKLSLTKSQQEAMKLFKEFYEGDDNNILILRGSAGTGKTTLLKLMKDYVNQLDKGCIAAAPTGRAAQILRSKGIAAQTIHKTIYTANKMTEDEDDNDVLTTFRLATHFIPANTLFLIDEASMISNINYDSDILRFGSGCLLQDLLDFAIQEKTNKIIFSGDINQLPPINMDYSPALNKEYLESLRPKCRVTEYELKEIVRQKKESSIINTATELKNGIEKDDYRFINIHYSNEVVEEKKEIIVPNYSADFNGARNETILIAYTNDQVFRYNQMIRNNLFPQIDDLNENERLLVVNNNQKYGILNGEQINLLEILSGTETVHVRPRGEENEISLKFREVRIQQVDEKSELTERECLIIENLLFSNKPGLERDERRALIVHFNQRHPGLKKHKDEYFTALLADPYINALQVKFGYAVTCHKAQGGEWNNVYFDFFSKNISRYSKDYFRFCYTGITRSKNFLKLINPPKKTVFISSVTEEDNLISEQTESYKTDLYEPFSEYLNELEKEFNISLILKELYFRNRYQFNFEDRAYRFDIIYNKKRKITTVSTVEFSDKLKALAEKLNSLVGKSIDAESEENILSFDNYPELGDIHNEIKDKLSPEGIEIVRVEHFSFMERYTFKKAAQLLEVNIWYNKNYLVTKMMPVAGEANSLYKEIKDILYG